MAIPVRPPPLLPSPTALRLANRGQKRDTRCECARLHGHVRVTLSPFRAQDLESDSHLRRPPNRDAALLPEALNTCNRALTLSCHTGPPDSRTAAIIFPLESHDPLECPAPSSAVRRLLGLGVRLLTRVDMWLMNGILSWYRTIRLL